MHSWLHRWLRMGRLWSWLWALMGGALALAGPAVAHATPQYAGSATCLPCHARQASLWQGSHHAQSMQVANDHTVQGNFNDVTVTHHGQVTRFLRRGAKYVVRTDGPDGKPHDFVIAYTFGVSPLQQYLIALPGGRLQALGVAWDARPKRQGGQRWYHLYPDAPPVAGESIHWTGRDQNWNFMCATCHSTGVRKNYDLAHDRFDTTWTDLDVACEACHGPGSAHLAWAHGDRREKPPGLGLSLPPLAARGQRFTWSAPGQKIANPTTPPQSAQAINETCAPCHSRRQALTPDSGAAVQPSLISPDQALHGAPFLDNFIPSLMAPGVYHADGQIDGEVFEFGSYLQSAMHQAGVACIDCHEPHGLGLRAQGNTLCGQCHQTAFYDRSEHHHHAADSAGALCVNCHMPTKTYMGVHERRDHSLRIPNPELSTRLGSPDACAKCHADWPGGQTAATIAQWTGQAANTGDAGASALASAWQGHPDADRLLAALQKAPSAMKQASILAAMPPGESTQWLQALRMAQQSPDGLLRLAAARALDGAGSAEALSMGVRLLSDPLRAVRIEAARALVGTPASRLSAAENEQLKRAVDELIQAELAAAERPESHVNMATIHAHLGDPQQAEQALQTALRLDSKFIPALVNLADLYRTQGRDAQAVPLLERAVQLAPRAAEPAHALGLLFVRLGRRGDALACLRIAASLAPDNERYSYVLRLAEREPAREALRSHAAPACPTQ